MVVKSPENNEFQPLQSQNENQAGLEQYSHPLPMISIAFRSPASLFELPTDSSKVFRQLIGITRLRYFSHVFVSLCFQLASI